MIILDEFIDFIEVIRIKKVAFYAKMPLDRFGKELRFVSVSLGDFVGLIELQNFSQLTRDSTLSSSLTCFCNWFMGVFIAGSFF